LVTFLLRKRKVTAPPGAPPGQRRYTPLSFQTDLHFQAIFHPLNKPLAQFKYAQQAIIFNNKNNSATAQRPPA
jgi:hypothetical protein